MGEVGKRSCDDLGAATRVDMTVWVDSLDGDVGIWRGRLIIEEVIHQEITILLADEAIRSALDVLVVITRGKGILILAAQTLHRVLLAIFQGIYLPTGVGVEDIGYQDMLALLQLPILRITLTIVVGVGTEEGHLFGLVPESALVIAIRQLGALEGIDVVAIWRTTDIDVGLPNIATSCGMAMLHHVFAFIFYLVVEGEVGVAAEEFIPALELLQESQERGEARRGKVTFFCLYAHWFGILERCVAKGEWDVITEDDLLVLWSEGEVFLEPFHLRGVKFAR